MPIIIIYSYEFVSFEKILHIIQVEALKGLESYFSIDF